MKAGDLSLVRLRVRPDSIILSFDCTVLVTSRDGFVQDKTADGLFVHRTRIISRYRYLANGIPFKPVTLSAIRQNLSLGYYIHSAGSDSRDSVATTDTLELKVIRHIGDEFEDELKLTNYSQHPLKLEFALEIDADFADQDSVAAGDPPLKGTLRARWDQFTSSCPTLTFDYQASDGHHRRDDAGPIEFHRGAEIWIESSVSAVAYRNGAIHFDIRLSPLESKRMRVHVRPLFYGDPGRGPFESVGTKAPPVPSKRSESGLAIGACGNVMSIASALTTISQATDDLTALRLHGLEIDCGWVPAAGVPMYIGFFGRDVMFSGLYSLMLGPEILLGALGLLARWQAPESDDWRDQQPGRMLHQAQISPLAVLNHNPFRRYYGTITTPALFSWALGRLWRWTANREAVARFIEPSLKALQWLDQYCTSECGGFYSYKQRSGEGLKNQAWKDSGYAMVHEDGSQVPDPIATSECQAYVYASKLNTAELLRHLGRTDEADLLSEQARELKKRFNDAFWMAGLDFFAMGLDKNGKQIRSISSNPLHCLNTGILDDALVSRTVDRLFKKDLYSGWGVRTLSADHVAYNPYSYQRGSVWPFEQGALALGLRRYRLYDHLNQLASDLFDVAAVFENNRLPELFGGQPRNAEHPFPSVYPEANWPQAWSAAAVVALIEALLGLKADAPADELIIDPHLPEFIPELRLQNLRVGNATVTLTFQRRKDGTTEFFVEDAVGALKIVKET
jgi:glycogen debranching enzyme